MPDARRINLDSGRIIALTTGVQCAVDSGDLGQDYGRELLDLLHRTCGVQLTVIETTQDQ